VGLWDLVFLQNLNYVDPSPRKIKQLQSLNIILTGAFSLDSSCRH